MNTRTHHGQTTGRATLIERLMESEEKPRSKKRDSVTLHFAGLLEDFPRCIYGHGKLRGAQVAVLLRPMDGQGLMARMMGDECFLWVGLDTDVAQRPTQSATYEQIIATLKGAQEKSGEAAKVTKSGRWSGVLLCDDGHPKIVLKRSVSTYAWLTLESDARANVWRWRAERKEDWFSKPAVNEGASAKLKEAIQVGVATAEGLLGPACSFRDSRRRSAFDQKYAEKHPLLIPVDPGNGFGDLKPPKSPKPPKPPKEPGKRGRKPAPAEADLEPGAKRGRKPASSTAKPSAQSPAPPESTSGKKGRRPAIAQAPTPAPEPAAQEIDPAKDKLLMDAFSQGFDVVLTKLLDQNKGGGGKATTESLRSPSGRGKAPKNAPASRRSHR